MLDKLIDRARLSTTYYSQHSKSVEKNYWKQTRYGGAETLRGCGACNLLGVSNPGLKGTKAGFCAGALWKPGLRFRWGVTTYASAGGSGISSIGFLFVSKPNASRAANCLFFSSASSRDSRLSNIGFSDLLRSNQAILRILFLRDPLVPGVAYKIDQL